MDKSNIWIKIIDHWSKRILKVVLLSLMMIILLQLLMNIDGVRTLIVPAERWEGTPYQFR